MRLQPNDSNLTLKTVLKMKRPLIKPLKCAALHQIWLVLFPLLYCRSLCNVMTTLGSFWDRALFTWLHRTVWCGIPPSLPFHLLSREKNHTPTISHNTRQTERWNIRRWTRCHAVRLSPSISLSLSRYMLCPGAVECLSITQIKKLLPCPAASWADCSN